MADYGSDIDESLAEEMEGLEDVSLGQEIEAALNAEPEYEIIDAPEDEEPAAGPEADVEDEENVDVGLDEDAVPPADAKQDPDCDIADDPALGESTISSSVCTRRDRIQIREMQSAHDSRMPDIPTGFEVCAMIISRACTLVANSQPMVEFDVFDPAKIARKELIQGKSLRAVLRGDTRWRWSDFKYFPRGFMDEDETTESLHEMPRGHFLMYVGSKNDRAILPFPCAPGNNSFIIIVITPFRRAPSYKSRS